MTLISCSATPLGSTAETWTYGYDHYNRLEWVEKRATDGGTLQQRVEFSYDVFGNRIEKTVDANGNGTVDSTLRTAYDGPMAWADIDTSGSLTMRYINGDGIDQRFARVDSSGTVAWYLTDHLGSVTFIINNTGAVIDQITYDPFGKIVAETSPGNGDRFKYTGREWDPETGLYYYRARYYDPALGRFTTEDSIGFSAGDGNLRRYVGNATTRATDPLGLYSVPTLLPAQIITTVPKRPPPFGPGGRLGGIPPHRTDNGLGLGSGLINQGAPVDTSGSVDLGQAFTLAMIKWWAPSSWTGAQILLSHSLQENPGDLEFGPDHFISKMITQSTEYQSLISRITKKLKSSKEGCIEGLDSIIFEESADLAAGIHSAEVYYQARIGGDGRYQINITITDTYDFRWFSVTALQEQSAFVWIVNNTAYLQQLLGMIQNYDIEFYLYLDGAFQKQ